MVIMMMNNIKSIYDVRQLLKQFGIFIYIGSREADLDLMEAEIQELYSVTCIPKNIFQESLLVIRKEKRNLREGKGANARD